MLSVVKELYLKRAFFLPDPEKVIYTMIKNVSMKLILLKVKLSKRLLKNMQMEQAKQKLQSFCSLTE